MNVIITNMMNCTGTAAGQSENYDYSSKVGAKEPVKVRKKLLFMLDETREN